MVEHTSGVICLAMEGSDLDRLQLPLMVSSEANEEAMYTAFTITADYRHDTTTGISAYDRALTVRQLSNPRWGLPGSPFMEEVVSSGTKLQDLHMFLCLSAHQNSAFAALKYAGPWIRANDVISVSFRQSLADPACCVRQTAFSGMHAWQHVCLRPIMREDCHQAAFLQPLFLLAEVDICGGCKFAIQAATCCSFWCSTFRACAAECMRLAEAMPPALREMEGLCQGQHSSMVEHHEACLFACTECSGLAARSRFAKGTHLHMITIWIVSQSISQLLFSHQPCFCYNLITYVEAFQGIHNPFLFIVLRLFCMHVAQLREFGTFGQVPARRLQAAWPHIPTAVSPWWGFGTARAH